MKIIKKIKVFYRLHFFDEIRLLRREMSGVESVLDLGCGYNSSLQYCKVKRSLGVEIFPRFSMFYYQLMMLLTKFVYFSPHNAFQLFAVKNINTSKQ